MRPLASLVALLTLATAATAQINLRGPQALQNRWNTMVNNCRQNAAFSTIYNEILTNLTNAPRRTTPNSSPISVS